MTHNRTMAEYENVLDDASELPRSERRQCERCGMRHATGRMRESNNSVKFYCLYCARRRARKRGDVTFVSRRWDWYYERLPGYWMIP